MKESLPNRRENKQFRDATQIPGMTKELRRRIHNNITGKGYTYQEIRRYAKEILGK